MTEKTMEQRALELSAEERQKVKSLYKIATIVLFIFVVAMIVNLAMLFVQRRQIMDLYDRWGAFEDKQQEVAQLTGQVTPTTGFNYDPDEAERNLELLEQAQAKNQELIDEIDALQKETPVETKGKTAYEISMALLDKVDALVKRTMIVMAVSTVAVLVFLGIFKAKNPLFSEKLYKEVRKLEKTGQTNAQM